MFSTDFCAEVKVGDIVRVKSYEMLENQFGPNCANLACGFPHTMTSICGHTFVVSELIVYTSDASPIRILCNTHSLNQKYNGWIVTNQMVEVIEHAGN